MTFSSGKNKIFIFFILISLLLNQFLSPLVYVTVSLPIHEMGHAVCAWLGSRPAFPVVFGGFTFIKDDRSTLLTFTMFIGLGLLLYIFHKRQAPRLFILFLALLLTFIKLTFFTDEQKLQEYILLAGQVAEIFIPSFFVSLYFYNYLGLKKWLFWKVLLGFYGSLRMIFSAKLWWGVVQGTQSLPMGSVMSVEGPAASDGDLNRLLELGWTEASLSGFFVKLWFTSLVIVSICYYLGRINKKSFSNAH